jgi:hypothetical protein
MNTIRLTLLNVRDFIGHKIIFIIKNKYILKEIISVSGNSIFIEYPEINNELDITLHETYVLLS